MAPEISTAKNEGPKLSRKLAVIDATGCTGCLVCMEFCEFDAIVKIPGPDPENLDWNCVCQVDLIQCTGCSLCAKPCPWDVIQMFSREVIPGEVVVDFREVPQENILLKAGNLSTGA